MDNRVVMRMRCWVPRVLLVMGLLLLVTLRPGWSALSAPLPSPAAQATTRTIEYTYDDAGRLTSAYAEGEGVATFAYDLNGNLRSIGDQLYVYLPLLLRSFK
jgi:hypothetical protein